RGATVTGVQTCALPILEQDGHRFVTETDTETLVHLIEESPGATLEERVIAALDHVEGTYGIAVVAEPDPGKIVVARRGSPVLLRSEGRRGGQERRRGLQ